MQVDWLRCCFQSIQPVAPVLYVLASEKSETMKILIITLTTIGIALCIYGIVTVNSMRPIPKKARTEIRGAEFVRFSLAHK